MAPSTEFTLERLLALAPQKQLVISFTNRVRIDFARTWAFHARAAGVAAFLIGATDRHALSELQHMEIPCFSMATNLPQGEWPWGSPSFKSLGPHKIELIYKTISWGFELVITDIDALVLRKPFAHMSRWPDAAFLTTSDHLGNTTADDGLETHNAIHSAFNIGYMFFRKSALPLVTEWRRVIAEQPRSRWDQGEFNRIARLGWNPRRTSGLSDPRLFWSYKSSLIGGVLSISLFCGGHNYFVSQFPQRLGMTPYSIHTTFQYGAAAGKRHRLREARVWIDPPEYYDPPEGLLVFPIDVPESLVYPKGGMTTRGHIALINHQMRQIRSGLALAHVLGRKLVLPSVICGYDKAWYPLSSAPTSRGAFGGARGFILPIRNCPVDHFLEIGMLNPTQTLREYSFLSNPRTPAAVLSSRATTELELEKGAAETERLAKDLGSFKVLNVTNLHTVDVVNSGLLSTIQRIAFTTKMRHAGGGWCCAPGIDAKQGMPGRAHFSLLKA